MSEERTHGGAIAFALIYFTFFLDNVLLTVLVPIIPDWVSGEALALWRAEPAPLAALLNRTGQHGPAGDAAGIGGAQAVVGLVLGAKAATQLVVAPLAGAAVSARGPAAVLRLATALLAAAALVLWGCGHVAGAGAACCVGAGRALHGAAAALCAVAGLALVAALPLPPRRRDRAIGALLGAVALGVLVGYPFGGATYALWSRGSPFLFLAAALLVDLVMQITFLDEEEFNRGGWEPVEGAGVGALRREARRGATGACAGAVLLTAGVMAALEPCLPPWVMRRFRPRRWAAGAVFLPDSAGYFVATTALGGWAAALGVERVAVGAQLGVALGALGVASAGSLRALVAPQLALGLGLGALDAALIPALLARRPRRAPQRAALLHAASSAAAAVGPVVGGLVSWCVGFETAMRALGVANVLHAALLYRALSRHPLSEQWGATAAEDPDTDSETEAEEKAEMQQLRPQEYAPLR